MRPAVRIVFAPLARRKKADRVFDEVRFGESAGRTIWLDPRVPNPAKTLYHELMHVRHPDWSEERVDAEEEMRWGRMSWKAKARLLQLLGSAKLEGEE